MAWNPSPEVAVARDAAAKLGDVEMCIVLYITKDSNLGMASYGKTSKLCKKAGLIGDIAFESVREFCGTPLYQRLD